MMHTLGEISLTGAILLLTILTHDNGKRIKDIEKRVEILTIRTGEKIHDRGSGTNIL